MNRIAGLLFVLCFFCCANYVSAQTKTCGNSAVLTPENNSVADKTPVVEPYDGTFRFIFTKGVKQVFTNDIFQLIEKNRKDDEEVVLVLSDYCKIQILSRKDIQAPDFKPFSESFIFEQNDAGIE